MVYVRCEVLFSLVVAGNMFLSLQNETTNVVTKIIVASS